jgi:amino acid adenylation domain-containing protein
MKMTEDTAALDSVYPLTPLQEGMLYDHMVKASPGLDIEQIVGRFHERLRTDLLRAAWDWVVARHPALRTRVYVAEGGEALQEVLAAVNHPFEVEDLSCVSDSEAEKRIEEYIRKDRERGFVLDRAPLSRVLVFLRGVERYTLVWTFHHIVLDGRSNARVLWEVYDRYSRLIAGEEPAPADIVGGFRDHVEQVRRPAGPDAESYWRSRLGPLENPTRLPQAGIGFGLTTCPDEHTQVSMSLTEARTKALHEAVARHGVTANSVLQAAWALLLSRYTGQKCVAFGTIRSGRASAQAPVGLFIHNVPTVVELDPAGSLLDLVRGLRNQHRQSRDHEQIPLSRVQGWSRLPANVPAFDTLFVYDHRDLNGMLRAWSAEWAGRDVILFERTSYPVTVLAYGLPQLRVTLRFDRRQFDPKVMSRILGHLDCVLEQYLNAPETPLERLRLMDDAERKHVIHELNRTQVGYPQGDTLDALFDAQVQRTPDAPAVWFEASSWTYRQLAERSEGVAAALTALGVGPETVVAVMVERSLEMMAALMGVLKAGGAFLPLNPEDPAARIEFMVENASAKVVLSQKKFAGLLERRLGHVVNVEDCLGVDASAKGPRGFMGTDRLAYVLYTSGSTGRPKGVMIEHGSICNRLRWMQDAYGLTAADRVLQKTPLTFDVSMWEVFWPILFGATVVMAAPGRHRDPRHIVEAIRSNGITFCHFVPSMLRHFLSEDGVEACTTLRGVVCSGEELTTADVRKFRSRLNAPLHNLYGPTEAAVDVSYWPCEREACCPSVPIGWPVANTRLYVLDPTGEPCPIAVPGELYIAGVQVGRGYVNRPDLTAERFVPDGISGFGGRMYRTGDRARVLPDGAIEFLGRNDLEVKLNGVRIDLREIEVAVREHVDVADAVVVLRDSAGGQKRLVAYYTHKQELAPADLRKWLRNLLPQTMVPSVCLPMEALPLGSAGKVARALLPEPPEPDLPNRGCRVAPGSDLEVLIGRIWAATLGVTEVGTDENFFDLGGHSMMLLTVHRKIEDELGTRFPITKSLEHTTVGALASYLENRGSINPRIARGRSRGAQRRVRSGINSAHQKENNAN